MGSHRSGDANHRCGVGIKGSSDASGSGTRLIAVATAHLLNWYSSKSTTGPGGVVRRPLRPQRNTPDVTTAGRQFMRQAMRR